jgi:hypothetical protein
MELTRQTVTAADISAEIEVLSYAYDGDLPIEVIARVDLGDGTNPLAGAGGNYTANIYLNGVLVSPATTVLVASGTEQTILVSRPVPLVTDDVISIRIIGQVTDTSTTVVSALRDATPAKADDLTGTGDVLVDHDYGGTDALRVLEPGTEASIGGVDIQAFLTEDYAAGRRSAAHRKGRTSSKADGRWQNPISLDQDDYTLVFSKAGLYSTRTVSLTVE